MRTPRALLGVATALSLTAASAGAGAAPMSVPDAAPKYEATIARDGRGVAHITGADWGSVAFGQGYALAEDRACTLLDQVIKVRGERARWFGPGAENEHVDSDFAYRHLGLWEDAPTRWADQPARVTATIDGYVAGVNAALDSGAADDSWCAGEPWVAPITAQDLYAYVSDILLLASSRNLITEIGAAQPPADADADAGASGEATSPSEPAAFARSPLRTVSAGASNGWALGAERSTTGGGLLLANPHFPWEGELRFWESHLTIPGELDVYGVGLSGLPGVQIGFNEAIAWTHTVSAGHRFTLYRYDLDPGDPTVYLVDGEPETMVATEYTIEVADVDGATTELTRTLYRTKHGPVVSVDPLGWSAEQAVAIGDANLETTGVLAQYLGMDAATSMDEFQAVHAEHQGVPWVNTISTSADGRAWLADISATPNLSPEALAAWEAARAEGGLIGLAYDQVGIVLLDGSDSLFDWVDDPEASAPGLIPFRDAPQLERADYVFNANDSHWLMHPDELLTGYSPLQGAEAVAPSPRTRTNVMLLEERDEPWSLDDVQRALFSNRSVLAETLRAPLVEACLASPQVDVDGTRVDLTSICAVLDSWDGTYDSDARGAIVFREWLGAMADGGELFADEFDPSDPAGTPSTPSTDTAAWLTALGRAAQLLTLAGIAFDAPLGEYQWEIRSGERLPIHGGTGLDGVANIVDCCAERATLQETADPGTRPVPGSMLRDVPGVGIGYPIERGASFVMTLQFGPDGPAAEAILTYGNPDDPSDPAYRAGLEHYSAGEWQPIAFHAEDVAAATVSTETVTG